MWLQQDVDLSALGSLAERLQYLRFGVAAVAGPARVAALVLCDGLGDERDLRPLALRWRRVAEIGESGLTGDDDRRWIDAAGDGGGARELVHDGIAIGAKEYAVAFEAGPVRAPAVQQVQRTAPHGLGPTSEPQGEVVRNAAGKCDDAARQVGGGFDGGALGWHVLGQVAVANDAVRDPTAGAGHHHGDERSCSSDVAGCEQHPHPAPRRSTSKLSAPSFSRRSRADMYGTKSPCCCR